MIELRLALFLPDEKDSQIFGYDTDGIWLKFEKKKSKSLNYL